MDVSAKIDTFSLDEVMKRLAAVAEETRNEILVEALDEAAVPILAGMQANCPVRSGKMKRNLRTYRGMRKGIPTLAIGSRERYAGLVELGHFVGPMALGESRAHVPAKPFMRRTYYDTRAEAIRDAQRHIADRLNRMAVSG